MSNQRYLEEFKIEEANQVTELSLLVVRMAANLGMSVHGLYAWIKRYSKSSRNSGNKETIRRPSYTVCEPSSNGLPKSETF